MATYRIHRLRDHLRGPFRFAPHVSGTAMVKPRDYKETEEFVEAGSPYAAFFAMKDSAEPLQLGDLLESDGSLQIFKFVGFEQAEWVLPEPAAGTPKPVASGAEAGQGVSALQ